MRHTKVPSGSKDALKQALRAVQLSCPRQLNSSSSSATGGGSSGRCRATSDSSPSFGPQQPSSSSSKASKSSWGSGWSGKRGGGGGGSVFKKQQQQQDGPQADSPQHQRAGSEAEQLDPQLEASIRMNVERANQTLQDIVQVSTQVS